MLSGEQMSKEDDMINELKQIRDARKGKNDIILIDDLRMIEDKRVGWGVDLGEFYTVIWQISKDYVIRRIQGHCPHDILVCETQ